MAAAFNLFFVQSDLKQDMLWYAEPPPVLCDILWQTEKLKTNQTCSISQQPGLDDAMASPLLGESIMMNRQ